MAELGEQIESNRLEQAQQQLESFRSRLTEFALKYRSRIQKDPAFREEFVSMCDLLGVDRIQTSRSSGSWLKDIVGIGTFYTDLAVQILTQCMIQRKSSYGSLLPVARCMELIQTDNVALEDVQRAIKSLDCLGAGGVRIVSIAKDLYISSLPDELSEDTSSVLSAYPDARGLTVEELTEKLSWPRDRVLHAVDALVREGVLWIDKFNGQCSYWILSLWCSSIDL